ncbi:phage tail family protein [Bacillus mojavensis]|uniref:phage tail domain-containing protein n=1 Tax=Bacillus mojavensis TaxID=72360 RepID=UPI002DB6FEF6|nr:phage tail domain-containing protein [Bacillus mojavensis]MEC1709829.1 phage tail family protein [Bacillus mojavensis]
MKRDLIVDGKYLSEYIKGVSLASFRPESPSFERESISSHPLWNGVSMYEKSASGKYASRKITVKINVIANSAYQFDVKRDAVYAFFASRSPYYVIDTRQPYKRWLVISDDAAYSIYLENGKQYQEVDITLTAIQGLAESLYDSTASMELKDEKFHLGMNIRRDSTPVYHFKNKNSFIVDNIGDETLDPVNYKYNVEMYLQGTDISITNTRTNETLTLNGKYSSSDKITLLSHHILKNSTPISDRTGRFPTLEPGENKFRIAGATSSDIKFITHFYYK